jgi:hypothetical protein
MENNSHQPWKNPLPVTVAVNCLSMIWDTMVRNWVAIEENPEIQESEYENAVKKLEKELEGKR